MFFIPIRYAYIIFFNHGNGSGWQEVYLPRKMTTDDLKRLKKDILPAATGFPHIWITGFNLIKWEFGSIDRLKGWVVK